jgi:hypothetical protein
MVLNQNVSQLELVVYLQSVDLLVTAVTSGVSR